MLFGRLSCRDSQINDHVARALRLVNSTVALAVSNYLQVNASSGQLVTAVSCERSGSCYTGYHACC